MAKGRNRRFRAGDRGSQAIVALENAWLALRELHSDIPPAVVVVVDVSARSRRRGHLAGWSWRARGDERIHEVAVNPNLFDDARQVLSTLLHEAAHAALMEEGLHGGTSGRYYHLKEFRDRCIQYGLECLFKDNRYGWTITQWPAGKNLPKVYQPIVKRLRNELPFGDEGRYQRQAGRPLPPSGNVRLSCSCKGRSVYASPPVALDGEIYCGICGSSFQRKS